MSDPIPGERPAAGPGVNHGFQQFGGRNEIGAMAVGPGAHAVSGGVVGVAADTAEQIRGFLRAYRELLPELRLEHSPESLDEIAPRVETVQRQVDSAEPEKHLLKDTLESLRAVLEHGLGGVATAALLGLLALIRL
jgi:hypothetical protein